ncbi:precorrin-6y C5,15-methyltransferase (decarboxylating) subunit CbiE [Actinomadura sp. WMMB 499]|uniref:precorrin-6y C5,15-methyltransferase (decarboxylating) subunit CbiE n=1 Tax=Actinomadura sp. WMMB 499 TaxID=1219491 RepID=UPI0012450BF7|nr:precorrin-6y C5,15-methyltransferase (decarboxylating) subunit CbiE [Actinomadura sp. WMMB 499]QFG20346.1 precorrin-6y C5,15-methyltransferase (decarboxylating) subunit CbiE [Actinomadura sp. WMMB 499]
MSEDAVNAGGPLGPPDGRDEGSGAREASERAAARTAVGAAVGEAPVTAEDVTAGHRVTVVGIGADGWDGLGGPAREAVRAAEVLVGGARQLGMLPDVAAECVAVAWPSPMLPALPALFEEHRGRRVVVVASGDPMFFGVGTTLVRLLGAANVRVLPHVSSVSLACARLGWSLEDTDVVTAVGRPLSALSRLLAPGRRVLVLSADAGTPGEVADLLAERGFGASEVTVLERLGGPDERVGPPRADVAALNIVAVHCRGAGVQVVPGLPDDAYDHDGQLTKREVRAITLARLAPVPGELLWDVGAGAGSIAVEWMRAHRACRAVAVEALVSRADGIRTNAERLGVPGLRVVVGEAPEALEGLDEPDAVFVGGGATVAGLIDACWAALRPGGRLVANAVTLESESALLEARGRLGGDLTRIEVSRAGPVGGFTGWRAKMPVTQWCAVKGR